MEVNISFLQNILNIASARLEGLWVKLHEGLHFYDFKIVRV